MAQDLPTLAFDTTAVFSIESDEDDTDIELEGVPETEVNTHDANREPSVNSVEFYKPGAEHHPALADGFSLCDRSDRVTEEFWSDVSLLAAAGIRGCVEEILDKVRQAKIKATGVRDVRRAISAISGNMVQFNLTFTVVLMNWAGAAEYIKTLTASLRKTLKCPDFCFETLVRKVEGNKELMAEHLSQVAGATLMMFSLDEEVSLLLSNYFGKRFVPKNQMWHTDNIVGGSYFALCFFGCGRYGARYRGSVPCTAVCTYPNMADISMRGAGWPLDWHALTIGTPPTVPSGTHLVAPANVIHFGVGKPAKQEDIPDGLDIRCVWFRMARHPRCDPLFDVEVDGGVTQMYEYSYLWDLRQYDLMCVSLCREQNKEWVGRDGAG